MSNNKSIHHMEGQDLTHGSILKELWSLAWPMMLSVFFYTLYNVVDAFWVSKISDEAIAAVSISQITLFIMAALSMGITVGSSVIIAMNIGAKNKKEAERVLGQSFVLASISAMFFTAVSLLFKRELLLASGASGAIFVPALDYFTITAAGSILFFLLITIMFAFNSQGDTFTLTKLFALSTLVNVVLDPLFIFGYAGFPNMGISGAAVATLISQAVFIVVAVYTLAKPNRTIQFRFSNLTFRWDSVKEVLKIGIPASLTQVINPIGLAALLFITSLSFQEPGAIAFSIGNRIEFLGFLPAVGFGFGAMAMISQSIGAGNKKRAQEIFSKSLIYGAGAATGLGILAILFADMIIRVFTTDPTVTHYTQSYIWIVALSYGFLAAMMIIASAFQAIGRSWPGFWIVFLRFVLIAIPLSYWFTAVLKLSIDALWLSVVIGNILAAVAGYVWIKREMRDLSLKEIPVH